MKIHNIRRDSVPAVANDEAYQMNVPGEPRTIRTVKDAAEELVRTTADDEMWKRFGKPEYRGQRAHDVRLELWETEQGRQLRHAVQMWGDMPLAKAQQQVRKAQADEWLKAGLEVIQKGFPLARR